jgi:hypothetical protein
VFIVISLEAMIGQEWGDNFDADQTRALGRSTANFQSRDFVSIKAGT